VNKKKQKNFGQLGYGRVGDKAPNAKNPAEAGFFHETIENGGN
jgi:hypothetical protein